MKTILVPIDFSDYSMHGAEAAVILAKKTGAVLHLLNVILKTDYFISGNPMFNTLPATYLLENSGENLKEAALKNLERMSRKSLFKGINVKYSVRTSAVVHTEIIKCSNEINAELVVIGSKGSSGIKNILLGSTAERVVRFSERPVLVIPSKLKSRQIRPIVFASDFHDEAYGIFPYVRMFAKILSADIHLLKINTIDQFNSTRDNIKIMNDFNKYFKTKCKVIIYDAFMKEEGILHYSGDVNAGLIALGTHGKKGLMRFFRPDISGGMVRLSQKPILVVNIKKFKLKNDIR